MNDAQLRCFHTAATEGSITRAAVRLNISQPTVSAQIKSLEKGYGVQLFDRVGGKIELTELGVLLKSITERIYTAQDEARDLLIGHRKTASGHLRIGTVAPFHVMPILQHLKIDHPDITFSLRVGNSATIYEAMSRYEIDVAILANLRIGDHKHHIQFLRRDDVVLLVNKDHALAERGSVDFSEIRDETVLIREEGSATRGIFLDAAATAEIQMTHLVEMGSREATKEAVAFGFGIAPLLHSEAGRDDRCTVVRLSSPVPRFDEFVACSKTMKRLPLVKAFLDAASVVSRMLETSSDTPGTTDESTRP